MVRKHASGPPRVSGVVAVGRGGGGKGARVDLPPAKGVAGRVGPGATFQPVDASFVDRSLDRRRGTDGVGPLPIRLPRFSFARKNAHICDAADPDVQTGPFAHPPLSPAPAVTRPPPLRTPGTAEVMSSKDPDRRGGRDRGQSSPSKSPPALSTSVSPHRQVDPFHSVGRKISENLPVGLKESNLTLGGSTGGILGRTRPTREMSFTATSTR